MKTVSAFAPVAKDMMTANAKTNNRTMTKVTTMLIFARAKRKTGASKAVTCTQTARSFAARMILCREK